MDLRELFSFDKLRESGRVSVITTEEFIEKEALSGNLEVLPSENVKRLDDTVRFTVIGRCESLKSDQRKYRAVCYSRFYAPTNTLR